MTMSYYYWIILMCVAFITRAAPRLVWPSAVQPDTYFHLLRAENIRKSGWRFCPHNDGISLFGEIYYPPLYHYILSLFGRKIRGIVEILSGAIVDLVAVVVFVCAAKYYFGGSISDGYLFLISLLFCMNPLLTYMGCGPRAYSGNARIIGQLFFMMAMLCMWSYCSGSGYVWALLFVVASVAILLSSKFAAQAWAFCMTLMSVAMMDVRILLLAMFSVLLCLVCTRGLYLKILKQQYYHLRNYSRSLRHLHPIVAKRTGGRVAGSWSDELKRLVFHSRSSLYFQRNLSVVLLIAVCLFTCARGTCEHIDLDRYMISWLLIMQIAFIVTSTKRFLFLGEAERYLEYSVVPLVLLLVNNIHYVFAEQGEYVVGAILIFYCFTYYIIQLVVFYLWQRTIAVDDDLTALFRHVNLLRPGKLLDITKAGMWKWAYRTHHSVVCPPLALAGDDGKKAIDEFYSVYPWPHGDLERYVKRYGVQYVPVEKSVVKRLLKAGVVYDFSRFTVFFENNKYIIYCLA